MESIGTRTKIVIAAGAIAIAAAAYLLFQPVPVEEEKKSPLPPRKPSPPKERSPQPRVVEIKPEEKHSLTLQEYLEYLKVINQLALEKFTRLKQDFVRERRANSDSNPQEYSEIVTRFKVKEREVMESSVNEMLETKHLDRNLYERAREEFVNRHEVATEREKLKQGLSVGSAPEELTVEQLKVIMNAEIKMLADAHSVDDEVANIETISRIEDRLFSEYGFEIDQIRAASIKYQSEVKGLSRQILRNFQRFKL